MATLWELQHVSMAGSPRARLSDVSLAIESGVTAVLGESGAGKTTLLNLLVGFEKVQGGSLHCHVKDENALGVYWSPPDGGLWPHLSVREHLAMVMPAATGDASDLLESFALTEVADARPSRLSMGERSRLSVARALASGAKVLVMDEPLANVDVARLPQFWTVIRDHLKRTSASLVFATHSAETVLAEASHVICLREGRVIYTGDVQTLYRNPPTLEAARCLGAVNWLTPDECSLWLDTQDSSPRPQAPTCIRPEHLSVDIDSAGPMVVQSSRFRGMLTDVTLQHAGSNSTRSFVCRSPASSDGTQAAVKAGDHVSLRVLFLLLLALLVPGCSKGEPQLEVKSFTYQSMPPDEATLPTPRAVGLGTDGQIIILDKAGRVLIFASNGKYLHHWWMPEYAAGKPEGVCLLKDGRIAIADTHYSRIVIFNPDGSVSHMFGSLGRETGQFIYPVKVVQDDNGFLYVVEYGGNDRVQKFTVEGEFVLQFGSFSAAPGDFSRPGGLAWHEGKIYVADADNHRVQVFHDDGRFIKVLTNGDEPLILDFPYDLCIGPDGLIYVIEYGAGRLTVITRDGELVGRYGSAGRGEGQFSTPWGLRVDANRRVWIADTGNRRIVELQL